MPPLPVNTYNLLSLAFSFQPNVLPLQAWRAGYNEFRNFELNVLFHSGPRYGTIPT